MKVARKLWTWALALCATFALVLGLSTVARADISAPATNKTLFDNGDGSYTLSLSVTGTADSSSESDKANVIIILDVSGSMDFPANTAGRTNANGTTVGYYGTANNSIWRLYYQYNGQYYPEGTGPQANQRHGTVYYRGNVNTYSNFGNGQRYNYTNNDTRLEVTKRAVNDLIDTLAAQNSTTADMVEISLVTFSTNSSANGTWYSGTDMSALKNIVSSAMAGGGTNWDDALYDARQVNSAHNQSDETTYVVFFSDGDPTYSNTTNNGDTATSHTHGNNSNDGTNNGTGGGSTQAREYNSAYYEANQLHNAGAKVYSIYAFGSNQTYMQTVTSYGNYGNSSTTVTGTYFFTANDETEIEDAFAKIANSISNAINVDHVDITDQITGLTATTLVNNATDFKYYRAGGENNKYGEFHPDHGEYGTEWDPTADNANEATFTEGTGVEWKLGDNFKLEDGVTYTVTFTVWPSQAAYDLVADLNNGKRDFDDLTADEKAQVVRTGAGTEESPYVYSIKTNPDGGATINYNVTDETNQTQEPTDSKGNPITWGADGTYSETVTNPDGSTTKIDYKNNFDGTYTITKVSTPKDPVIIDNPANTMGLTKTELELKKLWEDSLDPSQREDVGKSIVLDLYLGNSAYLEGLQLTEESHWTHIDTVTIAPGIMVDNTSPAYNTDEAYTHVTLDGKDYVILETGHDYYFKEEAIDGHFELTNYIYHPMLINGTLYNVEFEKSGDTITGVKAVKAMAEISATNTLKGGINITKVVKDETGANYNDPNPFTVTVTVTDPEGNALPVKTAGGTSYNIDYRIYYGPNNPNYDAAAGGGRSEHIYATGTSFEETIYVGDTIRVVNVEDDSLYTVTETVPTGYDSGYTVTYSISEGTADNPQPFPEGEDPSVQGNSASFAEVTNKFVFGSLEVTKTVTVPEGFTKDANKEFTFTFHLYTDSTKGTELTGNKYSYTKTAADGTPSTGTLEVGSTFTLKDGEKIKFDKLPETAYYEIVETAEDGYTATPEGGVASGTIVAKETAEAAFTNAYNAKPVEVDPPVKKNLTVPEGVTAPDIEGKFTFAISGSDGAPMPENTSITNSPDYELEDKPGYYEFGVITFTAPGEYTYTVTESGTVSGVTNDPAAQSGKTITFTVTDDGEGNLEVTPTTDSAVFEFTNVYKTGDLTVSKTVVSDVVSDATRAFNFTVTLSDTTISGTFGDMTFTNGVATFTLTDGQSKTASDLPEGVDYTVTEAEETNQAYTVTKTGDEGTISSTADATAAFTNTRVMTEVPVVKYWADEDYFVDGEPVEGYERPEITIHLLADGTEVASTTLTGATAADVTEWTYTFTNLPKYTDDGVEIEYSVTEDVPDGYEGTYETSTYIVNTPKDEEVLNPVELTIKKVDAETGNIIPTGATFTITPAPGENLPTTYTTSEDGTVTIKFEKDGEYTLVESAQPEGYQEPSGSYTISVEREFVEVKLNTEKSVWQWIYDLIFGEDTQALFDEGTNTLTVENPPVNTTVFAEKVWNDNDDQDGVRPDDIEVKLLADGEAVGDPVTLDESNEWSHRWTDLPAYADGELVKYTVEEVVVDKYQTTIEYGGYGIDDTYTIADGYTVTITNTYAPEQTSHQATKVWDDMDDINGLRPDSITVQLQADGVATGDPVTLPAEDGSWTYTWNNLPKYKDGGTEIVYTAIENPVPTGYTESYNNENSNITTITNSLVLTDDVEVTKAWDTNGDTTPPEGATVTFTLYADGEATDYAVELDGTADTEPTVTAGYESEAWVATFVMLPKYNAEGEEVEYTVVETGTYDGYACTGSPASNGGTITNSHNDDEKDVFYGTTETSIDGHLVSAGEVLTYTIAWNNNTNETGVVTITDEIPDFTEYNNDASPAADFDGETLTWTIEDVAPGESGTVTFSVTVSEDANGKKIENDATVQIGESTSTTNLVTTNIPVKDVLDESGTSIDEQSVQVGDILTYEVTFTIDKDVTYASVSDEVPAGTKYVEGSATGDWATIDDSGDTITWTFSGDEENMLEAGTYTVTFDVKVTEEALELAEMTIENTATITVNDDPEVETNTVTNTPEIGDLTISKTVTVPEGFELDEDKAFTFTIELKDKSGEALTGSYAYSGDYEGTISSGGTFSLKHDESITIADLPAGATYTITEDAEDGYTPATNPMTGTITGGETAVTAEFMNAYNTEPAEASFPVTKILTVPEGLEGPEEWEFTIDVEAKNGAPAAATMTGKVDQDNDTVTFGPFSFVAPGTYTYVVTESGDVAGVTPDATASTGQTVTITVEDDGEGNLTASVDPAQGITFTNTYDADPVKANFEVTKDLTGTPLTAGAFEFQLTAIDGAPMPEKTSATNDADGKVAFDEIEYTEPGVYEYEITEIPGSVGGYGYDDMTVTVTVTVTDNGEGALEADVKYSEDTEFNNTYEVSGGWTPTAKKELNGRTLEEGQFTFELLDQDGNVIQTKTNNASGAVQFDEITYSQKDFDNATTSTDDSDVEPGNRSAAPVIIDEVADDEAVETEVEAEPEPEAVIDETVDAVVEETVSDEAVADEPAEDGFDLLDTLANFLGLRGLFTPNIALAEGTSRETTLTYTIREVNDNKPGYTYDDHQVTVTVTIVDDGEGNMTVTPVYDGDTKFVNTYKAEGEIELAGIKTVTTETSKTLEEGQFNFQLKDADGNVLQEKTNGADGTFTFDAINYTEADAGKEYTYQIVEVNDGQIGYTYDGHTCTVTVKVEDNGDGTLAVTATYTDGEAATFDNPYEPLATSAPFKGTKTIEGKTLQDGEFTFELKDSEGTVVATATNKADGSIDFGTLEFKKEGTFTFTATEVVPSEPDPNMTYDTAEHTYTVEVVDNNGQLEATVTGEDGELVKFENEYVPEPVTYDPPVQKVIQGNPEKPETFTFQMKAVTEGAPMPDGSADGIKTIQITGAGTKEFGDMEFTEPGEWVYQINELKGSADGYTYDTKVYTLTITVTQNADGTLVLTPSYAVNGSKADAAVFTNVYTPTTPKTGDATPQVGMLALAGVIIAGIGAFGARRRED